MEPVPPAPGGPSPALRVLAKPPLRKLAKDLGEDLTTVTATGPSGIVTREDVHAAAGAVPEGLPAAADAGRGAVAAGQGWDGGPREERLPIRSVRKMTAANVSRSAFTAPHVTEFVTVDVTRTMRLVDRLRGSREMRDVRLSPLAVLVCPIATDRSPLAVVVRPMAKELFPLARVFSPIATEPIPIEASSQ